MRRFFLILFFILALNLYGCNTQSADNTDRQAHQKAFTELCDELFAHMVSADEITLNYTLSNPGAYGITKASSLLGSYDTQYILNDISYYNDALLKLRAIDKKLLPEKDRDTYNIIDKSLRIYDNYDKYILFEDPLSPVTGICERLPILLSEYHFYNEASVKTYIKMLEQIPAYFDEIAAFETKKAAAGCFMCKKIQTDVIKNLTDFSSKKDNNLLISTFNDKISEVKNISEASLEQYKGENKELVLNKVIPAYEKLALYIKNISSDENAEHGLCHFPQGKEYYTQLLYSQTNSDRSPDECFSLLSEALINCTAQVSKAFNKDFLLQEKLDDIAYPANEPDKIMKYLSSNISDSFPVSDKGVCDYSIKYVHPSLENTLSPAMYIIPPIDTYASDSIYINKAYTGQDELFSTLAHEGYPGHMYQTRYFMAENPHPIRLMLNFSGYCEGWATYAEMYSYNFCNLSPNAASVLKNDKLAILCLYSLSDIGVHYYGWDKEKVTRLLADYGINDTAAADEVYYAVLSEPALYPQYTVSCIEIVKMYQYSKEKLGTKFNEKAFHEFILKGGPTWFSLLQEKLNIWLIKQRKL